MSLRKALEHKLRSIRSYVLPSHIKAAGATIEKAQVVPPEKPLCIFDFKDIRIDNVSGRYLYHLVTDFEALNYSIAYTGRFRFMATMQAKKYKKLLLGRPYSIIPPGTFPPSSAVYITDNRDSIPPANTKHITVNYDHVRPNAHSSHSIEFPFFVHPKIQQGGYVQKLHQHLDGKTERPMQILFAGNASSSKYDSLILREKYDILSRRRVIDTALASLGPQLVRHPQRIEHLSTKSDRGRTLTIVTTQDLPIPADRWIDTLAKANFYLACPGVEMPLCHNLIECLAAGCIPILQYSQYLNPALQDGVNCLTFSDKTSLTTTLQKALNMPSEQIAHLRRNALTYYKTHLEPGCFAKKLLSNKDAIGSIFLNSYRVPRD